MQFPELADTAERMAEFGPVNKELWPEAGRCGSGNCSSCGGGAQCRNY